MTNTRLTDLFRNFRIPVKNADSGIREREVKMTKMVCGRSFVITQFFAECNQPVYQIIDLF